MRHKTELALSLAVLTALAALSYAGAFSLRFGGVLPEAYQRQLLDTLPLVVLAKLAALYTCRVHLALNRYVSFEDLVALAKATSLSALAIACVDALLLPENSIPRGVVAIDWGATLVAIGIMRSVPRAIRGLANQYGNESDGVHVLIVGADNEGESLLRVLRTASRRRYRVVGFVSDRPTHHGRRIADTPVLGGLSDLPQLVSKRRVEELLVAGSLPGRVVRSVIDKASELSIRVKVLPTYDQLLRQDVSVGPRPVAIEDLLRRDPVNLDVESMRGWLGGRTVLVTGSAGSIGSEVCRQLLRLRPSRLVVVDRSETGQFFLERELRSLGPPGIEVEVVLADLADATRLRSVCEQYRPDVIFHAAAYKHVPLMEQHPGEAVKNIVLATQNLVDSAEEFGASAFVMVSTDKAVNPTNVMGACKRVAERYVQAKSETSPCRFMTVRFGNVLDSSGSVAPIFREQIARGGPVTVTHPDITRYFMMIPEAAQLVIQAGVLGDGGEIFVLNMGDPVRITDLARDMIRLSGMREGEDIEIKFTGLRPGEKLYEELYADQEQHRVTNHPKIMVADCRPENLLAVNHLVGRLRNASNGPPEQVRSLLKDALPEAVFKEQRAAAA